MRAGAGEGCWAGGQMRVRSCCYPRPSGVGGGGAQVWCPGPWRQASRTFLPDSSAHEPAPVRHSTHRGTRGLRRLVLMLLSLRLPRTDRGTDSVPQLCTGAGRAPGSWLLRSLPALLQTQPLRRAPPTCGSGVGPPSRRASPGSEDVPSASLPPAATAGASGHAAGLGQDRGKPGHSRSLINLW